jgi:predicted metal-dependent hydrolase
MILPRPLLDFLALFNRGAYWESHEALEGAWRSSRSGFYKGLILYASAFVHAERGNSLGTAAQLAKAVGELEPYRPSYLGLDVDALVRHAERCRALAAERRAVAPRRLEPRPALVRGDEPELAAGGQ